MSPLLVTLLLGQVAADHAAPPNLVPHLGLSVGAYAERLEVGEDSDRRGLLFSGLVLGLDYRLPDVIDGLVLEGVSSLEVATVFERGQFPLRLTQQGRVTRPITAWLTVFAGLEAGFFVNVSDPTFSFFELGVPLGVRLGPVDITYLPRLTVPLAGEERDTLGGPRRHAVATALAPLMFEARYRFEGLAF